MLTWSHSGPLPHVAAPAQEEAQGRPRPLPALPHLGAPSPGHLQEGEAARAVGAAESSFLPGAMGSVLFRSVFAKWPSQWQHLASCSAAQKWQKVAEHP